MSVLNIHLVTIKDWMSNNFLHLYTLPGLAPEYTSDLLHPYITSRSLRSSDEGKLAVPRTRLKTKGDCAFEVVAPTLFLLTYRVWSLKMLFKKHKQMKTHLFKLTLFLHTMPLHCSNVWFFLESPVACLDVSLSYFILIFLFTMWLLFLLPVCFYFTCFCMCVYLCTHVCMYFRCTYIFLCLHVNFLLFIISTQ